MKEVRKQVPWNLPCVAGLPFERAVSSLIDEERRVYLLVRVYDLTYLETAAALGCSAIQVGRMVQHAGQSLRRAFATGVPHPGGEDGMKCERAESLVEALVDGELNTLTAWQLRRHLRRCGRCEAVEAMSRQISEEARVWAGRQVVPLGYEDRLIERLKAEGLYPPPEVPPGRLHVPRRGFLLTAGGIAASFALVLVLGNRTPADALEDTLDAMSRIQTAYAEGTLTNFLDTDLTGQRLPQSVRAEYWFRAPGDFRRRTEIVPGSSVYGGDLIVSGGRGYLIARSADDEAGQRVSVVPDAAQLTAFDFFSPRGFVKEAARRHRARVEAGVAQVGGEDTVIIRVVVQEGPEERYRWLLHADPSTRLLTHSEFKLERRLQGEWRPAQKATFERFEYGLSIPDEMFQP
jgi:hypothetical protein